MPTSSASPAHHGRRVLAGAARLLATTLAPLAAIGVAPVGAQGAAPNDVANRLIQSVTGYTALPEGDTFGESSGPVTVEQLAEMVGTAPPRQPAGASDGYTRMFATPAGDGVAMAIGFEMDESADFVAGFHDGAAGASDILLFPGEPSPLGDLVAHQTAVSETAPPTIVTAYASGSLTVMLGASDPVDSVTVLRQMVRDQAALTPPTATVADVGSAVPGAPRSSADEDSNAYRLGRTIGPVVVAGAAVWLVMRDTRRRRRAAWASDQTAPLDGHRASPPPSGARSAPSWESTPPSPPPPSPPPG